MQPGGLVTVAVISRSRAIKPRLVEEAWHKRERGLTETCPSHVAPRPPRGGGETAGRQCLAPCRLLSGRPGKAGPFGTVHARQQKEGREARPRKRRQQGRDRKVRAPAAAIQLQRCCIVGKKPRVPARKSIRPGTLDRLPADRPKVSSSQPTEEGEDEASSVGKRRPGWRARRRFFRVERRRHFARVVAWLGELAGNDHRRVDT